MASFKKIKKVIKGIYHDIFKYIYIPPFYLKPLEDDIKSRYYDAKVIPHALGNIENIDYTNSKEALEKSLSHKMNLLEADVCFTSDNVPVMAHEIAPETPSEEFLKTKIKGKFTPLSLDDIFNYMRNNPDLNIILDSKNEDTIKTAEYIKTNAKDIIDRFIIQTGYKRDCKKILKIYPFKIHWNFSIDGNVNYRLAFLIRNKIHSASISPKMVKNHKTLCYLNKYNIKAYAYTINDEKIANELYKKGVWGIITDCLY